MPNGIRVTINCAVSADGKLALAGGGRLRLSSDADFERVHRMRHDHDAILVGVGTVLKDDPSLLVKARHLPEGAGAPRHPLRVVLDGRLRTPAKARVLDDVAPTLLATTEGHARDVPGADVVACGPAGAPVDLHRLLDHLRDRGVRSLMVEGGGTTIHAFLRAGLVDDLFAYVAPVVVGGGAPTLADGDGARRPEDVLPLTLVDAKPFSDGVLLHWRPAGD